MNLLPWKFVSHMGQAKLRLQGMLDGTVDAAMLMEPFIAVAEKHDFIVFLDLQIGWSSVEAEVARLVGARTEVVRKLKEVESRLVERSTELNAVKARLRELEREARAQQPDGSGGDAEPPPSHVEAIDAPTACRVWVPIGMQRGATQRSTRPRLIHGPSEVPSNTAVDLPSAASR